MSRKAVSTYSSLLQDFREEFVLFSKGGLNSRERLLDEILQLMSQDPEFSDMFLAELEKQSLDFQDLKPILRKDDNDLFEELRAFARGEAIDFTDNNLLTLVSRYKHSPQFREVCHGDPSQHEAFLYWLAEYQRRIEADPTLAARELLGNLFILGMSIPLNTQLTGEMLSSSDADMPEFTANPAYLDAEEIMLLKRLYFEYPACRELFDGADVRTRLALKYFLYMEH